MNQLVRIGFVGCGLHAVQSLYPTFRLGVTGASPAQPEPLGELVACCDLDEAKARQTARAFGFERSYTDYAEMLEREELDCVFCVMHPNAQAKVARDCLAAGKPVFVEKPPTEKLEDAYELQELCEQSGQFVMPAFMKRFSAPYQRAQELIARPEFGVPTSYEARYNISSYPPRNVYDFLNGFSCHVLDLSRFFMGEISTVYSLYASPGRNGDARELLSYSERLDEPNSEELPQEEAWLMGLTFESGAVGFLQTNCLERVQERVCVTGQGSWVTVDDWRRVTAYDAGNTELPYVWEPHDQMPTDNEDFHTVHGYTGEVRHFVECVRDGRTPSPDITDGIAHLKLELAAKRSALEGRPVALSEIS